jgi:hypothetical protein
MADDSDEDMPYLVGVNFQTAHGRKLHVGHTFVGYVATEPKRMGVVYKRETVLYAGDNTRFNLPIAEPLFDALLLTFVGLLVITLLIAAKSILIPKRNPPSPKTAPNP